MARSGATRKRKDGAAEAVGLGTQGSASAPAAHEADLDWPMTQEEMDILSATRPGTLPWKPAGGRPTKRNPVTEGAIFAAIEAGATYELAAKAGGITYETFNEWRKADPQFSEAIARVEYEAALTRLNIIAAAARDDWKAAAWWLERRFPESYGKQVRAQVDHGGQVKIRIERVNDWRALGKAEISSSSAGDGE